MTKPIVTTEVPDEARAVASKVLGDMPEWWRSKFEDVYRQHGPSRRARRAVAVLLRRYHAWKERTARLRARQAADREARAQAREAAA